MEEREQQRYEPEEMDVPEEEEDIADMIIADGDIYAAPGVCHSEVRDIILAAGSSYLAQVVYSVPGAEEMRQRIAGGSE